MSNAESTEFAKKLTTQYGLKVPQEVVASAYSGTPKLRVLLSRSSFRADAARTNRTVTVQRERRNFLRNMIGFVGVFLAMLVGAKIAFFSPQAQQPSYVSNPKSSGGERLLANGSIISPNQSIAFNDPTYGPFLLIHLTNGQLVAYSSICTHAGCQVQFDPYAEEIVCPCHGAVYDPNHNAKVVSGPARSPLQTIPIRYDYATGDIYLA